MADKAYEGRRTEEGCVVTVDGAELALRLDLANHSPTGFEWGYAGSGPAQLALAILADHLGAGAHAERRAVEAHQRFKSRIVASLPRDAWRLTTREVEDALRRIELGR